MICAANKNDVTMSLHPYLLQQLRVKYVDFSKNECFMLFCLFDIRCFTWFIFNFSMF